MLRLPLCSWHCRWCGHINKPGKYCEKCQRPHVIMKAVVPKKSLHIMISQETYRLMKEIKCSNNLATFGMVIDQIVRGVA